MPVNQPSQPLKLSSEKGARLRGFLFTCPNWHQWNWAAVTRKQVHYNKLDVCEECGQKAVSIKRIAYRV
jgi:hypothetical protein